MTPAAGRLHSNVKTLGIVGGIGPESTIEYYRFILAGCRERGEEVPHIIIDSIDVNRGLALLGVNDLAGLADYLMNSLDRLARAGAEIALLAANTPHIVFDELERRSAIPMISLVEATCANAAALGLKRVALLGTGFTMRARFYPDAFRRAQVELIVPREDEIAFLHDKYINELLKNRFEAETRAAVLRIVERMRRDDHIGAVALAGTELPLLLRGFEPEGLTFLDTTLIHVAAAVDAIC